MSRRQHNRLWFRSLTALFAVWFLVATSEVSSLHACPMHDGPAGAMAMGHMNHPAQHDATPSVPSGHHSCTCIGACCAATSPPPVTSVVVAFAHEVIVESLTVVDVPVKPRVLWIDFALPFGNAPPMTAGA